MTRAERRAMWQERVEAYNASGLSVAAWCREQDIPDHPMHYWLKRLRQSESANEVGPQWLTLGVSNETASTVTGDGSVLINMNRCTVEVRPGVDLNLFEKAFLTPQGQPSAAFICPGHPLLDATVDLTIERYRDLLRRGTVLADENEEIARMWRANKALQSTPVLPRPLRKLCSSVVQGR